MKPTSLVIVIALTLISGCHYRHIQDQEKRILYSSAEIQQEPPTPRIKKIHGNNFSSFLTVRYKDGTRKQIAIKDVWGYVDGGTLCRRVGKNFLAIVTQQPDLIEYSSMPISRYDVITKATIWRDGPHYFSKTLDSKLYQSKKDALNGE